jgi:primosomal protein N' (replication factor Y)
VQRCDNCASAVSLLAKPAKGEIGVLTCSRCGSERPALCSSCGSGRLATLRPGVTRAAEEVAALLGVEVAELSGSSTEVPKAPVIVGTEAVLHRVRAAAMVGFLDFDQHLLAPRFRAGEEALVLLARASRLVGGRSGSAPVVLRTSIPDHPVLEAAGTGDPGLLREDEDKRRRLLSLPPYSALARLTGNDADEVSTRLDGVQVSKASDGYLVRAPDAEAMAGAWAAVVGAEPAGWAALDVRVEVDPLDV